MPKFIHGRIFPILLLKTICVKVQNQILTQPKRRFCLQSLSAVLRSFLQTVRTRRKTDGGQVLSLTLFANRSQNGNTGKAAAIQEHCKKHHHQNRNRQSLLHGTVWYLLKCCAVSNLSTSALLNALRIPLHSSLPRPHVHLSAVFCPCYIKQSPLSPSESQRILRGNCLFQWIHGPEP